MSVYKGIIIIQLSIDSQNCTQCMFLPIEGDWMLGKRQQHKQQMSRTYHPSKLHWLVGWVVFPHQAVLPLQLDLFRDTASDQGWIPPKMSLHMTTKMHQPDKFITSCRLQTHACIHLAWPCMHADLQLHAYHNQIPMHACICEHNTDLLAIMHACTNYIPHSYACMYTTWPLIHADLQLQAMYHIRFFWKQLIMKTLKGHPFYWQLDTAWILAKIALLVDVFSETKISYFDNTSRSNPIKRQTHNTLYSYHNTCTTRQINSHAVSCSKVSMYKLLWSKVSHTLGYL